MKEYIKIQVSLKEKLLFFFFGIIPKEKISINKIESKNLTEGKMKGGNGFIKESMNNIQPKFKPPSPKPFFENNDVKIESNL